MDALVGTLETAVTTMLVHPAFPIRRGAAVALRSLCSSKPNLVPKYVKQCSQALQRARTNALAVVREKKAQGSNRYKGHLVHINGYATALSALLALGRGNGHGVSEDSLEMAFRIAKTLLDSSTQECPDPGLSLNAAIGAWNIVGSICAARADYVEDVLPDLVKLWNTALSVNKQKQDKRYLFALRAMGVAATALESFLQTHPGLVSTHKLAPTVVQWIKNLYGNTKAKSGALGGHLTEALHSVKLHASRALAQLPVSKYTALHISQLKLTAAMLIEGPRSSLISSVVENEEEFLQYNPLAGATKRLGWSAVIHDAAWVWRSSDEDVHKWTFKQSNVTRDLVDALILSFPVVFQFQSQKNQENFLKHFLQCKSVVTAASQRATMQVNVCLALYKLCQFMRESRMAFSSQTQLDLLQKIVQDNLAFTMEGDVGLAYCAAHIIGSLPSIHPKSQSARSADREAVNRYTSGIISSLKQMILSSESANVKAGCALAIGCVHQCIGAVRSSPLAQASMDTLGKLAMSSALVSEIAPPTSSSFTASITSSLSLSTAGSYRLYCFVLYAFYQVVHGAGGTIVSNKKRIFNLTNSLLFREDFVDWLGNLAVIEKIVNSMFSSLGPELAPETGLLHRWSGISRFSEATEYAPAIIAAAKFNQVLVLFAPKSIDTVQKAESLVPRLHSQNVFVRQALAKYLRQLLQLNSHLLVGDSVNGSYLVNLFKVYDSEADPAVLACLRSIVSSAVEETARAANAWVREDVEKSPPLLSQWLDLLKQLIKPSSSGRPVEAATEGKADEEGEQESMGLAGPTEDNSGSKFAPKERTRALAIDCLRMLVVGLEKNSPHFDLMAAKRLRVAGAGADYMVFLLGDALQLSYQATTSRSESIAVAGLRLLHVLLDRFGQCMDPLYEDFDAEDAAGGAGGNETVSRRELFDLLHRPSDSEGCPVECVRHLGEDVSRVGKATAEAGDTGPTPCILQQYDAQLRSTLSRCLRPASGPDVVLATAPVLAAYFRSALETENPGDVLGTIVEGLRSAGELKYPQHSRETSAAMRRALLATVADTYNCCSCTCEERRNTELAKKYHAVLEYLKDALPSLQEEWKRCLMDYAVLATQSRSIQRSWVGLYFGPASELSSTTLGPCLEALSSGLAASADDGSEREEDARTNLVVGLALGCLAQETEEVDVCSQCLVALKHVLDRRELPLSVLQEILVTLAVLVRQNERKIQLLVLLVVGPLLDRLIQCRAAAVTEEEVSEINALFGTLQELPLFVLFQQIPSLRQRRPGEQGSKQGNLAFRDRSSNSDICLLLRVSLFDLGRISSSAPAADYMTFAPPVMMLLMDLLESLMRAESPNASLVCAALGAMRSVLQNSKMEGQEQWGLLLENALLTAVGRRGLGWSHGLVMFALFERLASRQAGGVLRQLEKETGACWRFWQVLDGYLGREVDAWQLLAVLRPLEAFVVGSVEAGQEKAASSSARGVAAVGLKLWELSASSVTFLLRRFPAVANGSAEAVECVTLCVRFLLRLHELAPSEEAKLRILTVVIPVLVSLLGHSGEAAFRMVALTVLLGLAQQTATAFRNVLSVLPSSEQASVEKAFRTHLSEQQAGTGRENGGADQTRSRRRQYQEEEMELDLDLDAF